MTTFPLHKQDLGKPNTAFPRAQHSQTVAMTGALRKNKAVEVAGMFSEEPGPSTLDFRAHLLRERKLEKGEEATGFSDASHSVMMIILGADRYPPVAHLRQFTSGLTEPAGVFRASETDEARLEAGKNILELCAHYDALDHVVRSLARRFSPHQGLS
jgi:hypothetical protein